MPDWAPLRAHFPNASSETHTERAETQTSEGVDLVRLGAFSVVGIGLVAIGGYTYPQMGSWDSPIAHFITTFTTTTLGMVVLVFTALHAMRRSQISWQRGLGACVLLTCLLCLPFTVAMLMQLHRIERSISAMSFVLTIAPDGRRLIISGMLGPGLIHRVTQQLRDDQLEAIQLDSTGGLLLQAKELADLITERRLVTHAVGKCYSACLLPFLSGRERYAHVTTTFGLHTPQIGGDVTEFMRASEGELAEDYFANLRALGLSEKYISLGRERKGNDFSWATAVDLLGDGIVNAVYTDQHVLTNASEAKWVYILETLAAGNATTPSRAGDALLTTMSIVYKTRPDVVRRDVDDFYTAVSKSNNADIALASKKMFARITPDATLAASAATVHEYLKVSARILRHFKDAGDWESCAQMGYDGALQNADAIPADAREQLLVTIAAMVASAAGNNWQKREIVSASKRIESISNDAAVGLTRYGTSVDMIENNRRTQCLFSMALFDALVQGASQSAANDYSYLISQ